MEQRIEKIEQRLEKDEGRIQKLEEDKDDIVESEKLLLKMARYHRAGLQELRANMEIEMGDIRERFDTIERNMATKEDVADLKATQSEHGDLLKDHGDLLREILQLLKPRLE